MFQETEEQTGIAVQQQTVSELDYQRHYSHSYNTVTAGSNVASSPRAIERQNVAVACL